MYGNIVNHVVALVQYSFIPCGEAFHEGSRGTAHRCFYRLVYPLDRFGCLQNLMAVALRILIPRTQLPWSVHLISQIPHLHIVGIFMAVLFPQFRPV